MATAVHATIRALVDARRTGRPAPAAALPQLPDAEAAYAVQDGVARELDAWPATGARHWKSGGASRSAVLTHAPLPDAGVRESPTGSEGWPLRLRGIEAEIALRLASDVDAATALRLDGAAAAALVDAMCVAIEIVESRWAEGLAAPALAKLADLQSHGALVLGRFVPFARRDWTRQVCRVHIGERPIVERRGSHALADPAFVLPAWLRHATREGRTVAAGTVVTTGTWCGLLQADAGERVHAEFPGIGEATVQL